MDLSVFQRINPCGHAGMAVTDMATSSGQSPDFDEVAAKLAGIFARMLGYSELNQVYNAGFPSSIEVVSD